MSPTAKVERNGRLINPGPGQSWTMRILEQGVPPERHLVVTDTATKETLVKEPVPTEEFGVAATTERVFEKLGTPAEILTNGNLSFVQKNFRYPLKQMGIRHFIVSDPWPVDEAEPPTLSRRFRIIR